ncbi:MAG: hypothetical protein ACK5PF_10020, partial [bacterium]
MNTGNPASEASAYGASPRAGAAAHRKPGVRATQASRRLSASVPSGSLLRRRDVRVFGKGTCAACGDGTGPCRCRHGPGDPHTA